TQVLQRSLLFVAVVVNANTAADRGFILVRRICKAKARSNVAVLDCSTGAVASRISREIKSKRCTGRISGIRVYAGGEDLGLLSRDEAVERLSAELVVVVRSINLVSGSQGKRQIVLYFPLVLSIGIVLISTGVDRGA